MDLEQILHAVKTWPSDDQEDFREAADWFETDAGMTGPEAARKAYGLLLPLIRGEAGAAA